MPAGMRASHDVRLHAVSCSSPGNCAAVGRLTDAHQHGWGLLLNDHSGVWGRIVKAKLPAGASARYGANLASVSCPSAGNCAAAGLYETGGFTALVLLTQSSWTWGQGVAPKLPANGTSPGALLRVSCAAPGDCAAVGSYVADQDTEEGLLLDESTGVWGSGDEAAVPGNGSGYLRSVSCSSPGECTAVGAYFDDAGVAHGLLVSESSGMWGAGVEANAPANAGKVVALGPVSCSSPGSCTAVGTYTDTQGNAGILLTETSGIWSPGVKASLPANASSIGNVWLPSVSCSSPGNCTAVGSYLTKHDGQQGLLLTESHGVWARGVQASLPANAAARPGTQEGFVAGPGLLSVSCWAAGSCFAVGSYFDRSGGTHGLLLGESSGKWGHGVQARAPANAAARPEVGLWSVSCPSAKGCVAVGQYHDRTGNTDGLLLDTA